MAIEFLRSLAPATDGDVARAVAVLPSRFDEDALVRNVARPDAGAAAAEDLRTEDAFHGELERPARTRGERAPAAHASAGERRPPLAQAADAAMRAIPEALPGDTAARPAEPLRRASVAKPHGPAQRLETAPQRTELASHAAPAAAEARGVSSEARSIDTFAVGAPLSEACVAERVSRARDEGTRVHVSIGRIEVIAANVPQPAAPRRGSPPRQGTVALADYLRGAKEGAR